MTHHPFRRARTSILLLGMLALLAGCGAWGPTTDGNGPADGQVAATSAATAAPGPPLQVDLAIRDFTLRATDAPCAGARPYLDLHPTQPYMVQDLAGATVARGELPQGLSIKATDLDFGEAPREPTFCVFSLDLPGLEPGDYQLTAGDDRTIPFEVPHDGADPIPVNFPPTAPGGSDPHGRDPGAPATKDS